MKPTRYFVTFIILCASALFAAPPEGKWKLVFEDDFNYENAALEKTWWVQNSSSNHILSSRWRENVKAEGGFLYLLNRKEARGGQEWTSANIRTKGKFGYGYYECRYKYAKSAGINNAFWLCANNREIDVNEGHYPNEINTNVHDRTLNRVDEKGNKIHHASSMAIPIGERGRPDAHIQLNQPAMMKKIRITTQQRGGVHIREIALYEEGAKGYPKILIGEKPEKYSLVNFAKGAKVSASGILNETRGGADPAVKFAPENAVDGDMKTSWVSQPTGEKFIELELPEERNIACVQFLSGWKSAEVWNNCLTQYKVQYFKDGAWADLAVKNQDDSKRVDLSEEFHVYACEWGKDEIAYYFDGKEIRRIKNEWFYEPMHIWLSTAILLWAGDGEIPESADGTSMVVDWVKYYEKE